MMLQVVQELSFKEEKEKVRGRRVGRAEESQRMMTECRRTKFRMRRNRCERRRGRRVEERM